MNVAAIFAGGVGKRMYSRDIPKQFLMIHGKPIIIHTLLLFEDNPHIDTICISCVPSMMDYLHTLVNKYHITKVKKIVPGGSTGQESIYCCLCAAESIVDKPHSTVLIHDGVRPLITDGTITDNVVSVQKYGSAVTSVPAKETMLRMDENNMVSAIPQRSQMRLARAPQSFWLDEILSAHRLARREGRLSFVDSASLMFYYGHSLHLVDGPSENIKITTQEDFFMMQALLDAKENRQLFEKQ